MYSTNLLNKMIGLAVLVLHTIGRHPILVELEGKFQGLCSDAPGLVAAFTKLLGKVVDDLDVIDEIHNIVLRLNLEPGGLPVQHTLGLLVTELSSGPTRHNN